MQPVDELEALRIDQRHALHQGVQIRPSRKRLVYGGPFAGDCRRNPARRQILRHVACFKPRRKDPGYPALLQNLDVGLGKRPAFLENTALVLHRMRQDRTLGRAHLEFAELHVASGPSRSTFVISAVIATAISEAPLAPISSPMGA